jgi:flagellar assembly factor FliW
LKILGGITPFKQEQFVLQPEVDAPPFFRLDAKESDLAFHVLDPFAVASDYAPEISPEDEKALGLGEGESPEIWTIVNLNRGAADATVNLAAPILVNCRTGVAKQVIPLNVQNCPVRHRLFPKD